MVTCRSSGVNTASAVVNAGRTRLISIHAACTGSAPTTIKVFDNASAASGTELARMILQPESSLEFDMHGVLALNGLYLSISAGAGEGAAVSVEFG